MAELTAIASSASDGADRAVLVEDASRVVHEEALKEAISEAVSLATRVDDIREASKTLGTTGFVVHSVPLAVYAFVRHGRDPMDALTTLISAGGDTDSHAAILGGWLGALHGEARLPLELVGRIQDGSFGPTHLRALAKALGGGGGAPSYSSLYALLRNLALYPVVIAHGFRRLLP